MSHQQDATIVVGAGIVGAATAFHLQQAGAGRVILLDAGEPGRATSDAGAGFVGYWTAGYLPVASSDEFALEDYGVGFYRSLSAGGGSIGFRGNGSLFVAVSESGAPDVAALADHPLAPVGTRQLSGSEVAELSGQLLSRDAVTTAVHHPGGIQISAGLATRELAAAASAMGVEVRGNSPVLEVLVDDGRVIGVRTSDGDLAAHAVVLACGAWANRLLAPLNQQVPLGRKIASRVVSPPSGVSALTPTVMVPEWSGLWVRENEGGLTWGNTVGYAPLHEHGIEIEAGGHPRVQCLIDDMIDYLSPRLSSLMPEHDVSCAEWSQGLPCFTPDGRFIAGPVTAIPGLHVAAGDNEAGVTHGPGIGRLMADLVLERTVDYLDPASFRLDRFPRGDLSDADVFAQTPDF